MTAARFEAVFGQAPAHSGFTPGRVNLLGEHTDYNGGMVLPMALSQGLSISLSPRTDETVQIHSTQFDTQATRHLHDSPQDHWSDYALGAVIYAQKTGYLTGGADIVIDTTLPAGAGLSSSAALIVGILKQARQYARSDMTDTEIAVLARRVENEFIGMPCGIMDQMAVAVAAPGEALALNTQSLAYTQVPLPPDYHMAVVHSGHYRKLSEGRYKIRKEECDSVKAHLGLEDICLLSDEDMTQLDTLSESLQRRARHCVSEHRRTVQAISALQNQDMAHFGQLMIESHASMRDDFEITLPVLDALVTDAVSCGALGARMTGGGFGGCIIACVPKAQFENWRTELLARHPQAFYVC